MDCTRARKLRELQHVLACPSNNDLANAIENNVIGHNFFTQKEIKIANNIFGPSIPGLKGKIVKQKSKLPQEDKSISIPPTIVEYFKAGITLSINVMHVNKVAFLVSKSYHLNYYKCIPIRNKNKAKFMEALLQMCNKYKQQGVFRVTQIEADSAFRCIESNLQAEPFGIKLVTCNTDKHVPRVKRGII